MAARAMRLRAGLIALTLAATAEAVPPGHVPPPGPRGAAVWHGSADEPSLKQLIAAQAAMAPHFADCMAGTPRGMTGRMMLPTVFAPSGEVTWTFLSEPPADFERCLDRAAREYMRVPAFRAQAVLVLFPLGDSQWN